MSNFVRVKKIPEDLSKDEFVIATPHFHDFVEAAVLKKPKSGVTTVNYLREMISSIGLKYIGEDFDAMREVNVSYHKGRPFSSLEDVNAILVDLFDKHFPDMLDAFVEYHIVKRPKGVKVIYFLGSSDYTSKFLDHGVHEILERDLDKLLGKKPKKIVGKPAITNEEAQLLKQ